jgi:hypothetical protein
LASRDDPDERAVADYRDLWQRGGGSGIGADQLGAVRRRPQRASVQHARHPQVGREPLSAGHHRR